MSTDEVYRQKYTRIARDFWELQQVDKTKEEIEYDNLIKELETMLVNYRDEIEQLENQNEELQKEIGDAARIFAEYDQLKEEEKYLLELKNDIFKNKNQ